MLKTCVKNNLKGVFNDFQRLLKGFLIGFLMCFQDVLNELFNAKSSKICVVAWIFYGFPIVFKCFERVFLMLFKLVVFIVV